MHSGFISLLLFPFFLILFDEFPCQLLGFVFPEDSERTVAEVAVRGMESAAVDLLAPEVTMAIAVGSSEGLAAASQEIALVMPSSSLPASPSPLLAFGGLSLADDVVQQFDATHRLSELTTAWGSLSTLVTSFGERLQVSFSELLSLGVHYSPILISCFSLFLFAQSFSHDHISFFFSSKNKKKLSSKVSTLKAELDLCQVELETERQTHQKEEKALRARVVEAKKQRDAAA